MLIQRETKSELAAKFTKDLDRRDKEARIINFRTQHLQQWRIEGMHAEERAEVERKRVIQEEIDRKEVIRLKKEHQAIVEADTKILEDDKCITAEVQAIMIRAGMIHYERSVTEETKIDDIFKRAAVSSKKKSKEKDGKEKKGIKEKKEVRPKTQANSSRPVTRETKQSSEAETSSHAPVDATKMLLTIRRENGEELLEIKKYYKKERHRRVKKVLNTPFEQDFDSTGDVTYVKGKFIGEVGALGFAAELTRGACPMLEILDFSHNEITSNGAGMLFQGMKTANLLNVRYLQLQGNFLSHLALDYMYEVCSSGIFMNLQVLNLSQNELRDEGVNSLLKIIIDGYLLNIHEIHLQNNSITDIGFSKMMKLMLSIQDVKCPLIQRLGLELNLVSAEMKRKFAPYPLYMSL